VHAADIVGRETMVLVVGRYERVHRCLERSCLGILDLSYGPDAEEILEDAVSRPRLELRFSQAGSVVAAASFHVRQFRPVG
jgi:hypothetical protein